ncbi:MAG: FAD:protein FMN transferase [Myxococcales bacterium]|nr:FAD:protein FMN transferase [Myxococcales bacterium]
MRVTAALLPVAVVLTACRVDPAPEALELRGETMGTTYAVAVTRTSSQLTRETVEDAAVGILARVDSLMSTWREDSELTRFNRSRGSEWFAVSQETALVVEEALRVSELSSGAFDPTVLPLVELWGFAGAPVESLPPARGALSHARGRVDARQLRVRATPPALRKERANLEVDLSSIAKGYAVDRIAEALTAIGATDFLVEIGGELRAAGRNRRGEAWRVAVEQPTLERGRVQTLVALRDEAIATSGSYRNYAARGGERFAHILDPATGAPPASGVVSTSVVSPTAMRADALATALFAMGPERGVELAEREGVGVLFLVIDEDGLRELSNAAFDARRIPAAPPGRE